ncbi:Penicillin-binding protein F [Thalassovita gelatinovora]|uniref:peptidoglycan glycosyltransferase n=1 Tax=Thalassovita gelatinovora TaxID=53501 RepID=A0A0P1F9D3_THAGE|nr:penicillin-binding protein 1C [Thalassovita gelatinovora]QIZ81240.1 penicillin-binding protein 1C [Thalassovita gelatinovora]CUH64644.1 Penicillin-binding protein F [Thalassovita gelatinovora]SEP94366.1 penicillin-binding protein 1C [Thalassovita gelatinovora]
MKRIWPVFLVVALLAGAGLRDGVDHWVARTVLPPLIVDSSVELRDRKGELLRAYTVADGLWRLPVSRTDVDARYIDMLLAYEDKRFWQHGGVDLRALTRSALQALWHGRIVSGGSTLSMQVARLLENGGTGAWAGKLRQMRVALALERRAGKAAILDLYLQLAPFGGNIEGVRAASLSYFGKEPARLNPAQAALLVALPQSPETRRPDRHPQAALAARQRVMQRALQNGVLKPEDITAAAYDPVPHQRRSFPALAPHAADHARARMPDRQRLTLTLDAGLQARLEDLADLSLRGKSERLSIAILVADHRSGEILASVGSRRYAPGRGQGFIDMTQALRSPGSTLKPLVYGLGFDQGLIHPDTLINDRPVAFGAYAPQNFDGHFRGEIKVSRALQKSLNIPVVLLTEEIGPGRLMAALRRSGAEPVIPGGKPGLAVALGGIGITLHDLVQLYAGLANSGKAVQLHIETQETENSARIVSRSAAWQVGHILSGLVPPDGAPRNHLAYKTGTSYGHRDAWAVGYDGGHVIGVWIGRPEGTPVPGAFGGDLAAPVLFEAFQRLKPMLDPLPPPPPETLILGTADLPQPLQRFRGRHAVFADAPDAPKLAFPPDGARLALDGAGLTIKLRDGAPPFTVLADGAAVLTGQYGRQINIGPVGNGFVNLAVIDAKGRSDQVQLQIE